eukprot:CAMPEP_0119045718 /NCGR_PEP_ID=MMETSP1177-20130426/42157_1 /TAXON_ID=2985 /ORGANISM="Ochromonas sp, Strain CCMP1899" /LENGTH=318 /DNA_ID=CAMNT_0007017991 /DNA_START=344 /DNA_END=1301 /DNA_ORIENTATION=+
MANSDSIEHPGPGRDVMANSNVTFLGVGRNLGDGLPKVLKQIENLAARFQYSRAIFVEGGSTDDTSLQLKNWVKSSIVNRTVITMPSNITYEKSGNFKGIKLPREGRLADARNVGLKELYRLEKTGVKTEYVIIIDLDVLGWDPRGVLDSFKRNSKVNGKAAWDVICANGVLMHGVYRDTYAFRTDKLNTNHHWAGGDHLAYNISLDSKKSYRLNLKLAQSQAQSLMNFAGYGQVLKVQSCFGGLAIYRFEALAGCFYSYRHEEKPYMLDCEHVLFHKCMIEKHKARIFSNSNMKLWYGHSPLATVTFEKAYGYFMGK